VADQSGQTIATVTSAKPLTQEQVERMRAGLAAQYDRDVKINQLIDPSVLGGFRVQIGDDVIDSTIAARLGELKLKLAG
jgi:F-type H+-transporting ATPase subunit delta